VNYKIIDIPQGTPEWLALRYGYVTASQVPVLFDLSPYQTRLRLFEEKTLKKETQNTKGKEVLFARGHSAEAAGRIYLEERLGLDLKPAVLVSVLYPDLMASLDGFCQKTKIIFEAKLVGAKVLEEIREGQIPSMHLCQVQTALLVSGAAKCLYFATSLEGDSHLAEIFPDLAYQEEIALAAKKFMNCVRSGETPEPGERDFANVSDPLFERYAAVHLQFKALEAELAVLREKILQGYSEQRRVRSGAVTMVTSIRRGSIDYDKVPVLRGVDLEKYRKASTEVVTLKVEKSKTMKGVA
jgi:putative phage-type endonuclease